MDVDAADERRQQSSTRAILLFAVLLAAGSCNWRPRGWEMKDYIDLARSHFFTFGDWLSGVSARVRVRILFVETRKRKVSSKCRPNETSQ
jgi:hypothetical protein